MIVSMETVTFFTERIIVPSKLDDVCTATRNIPSRNLICNIIIALLLCGHFDALFFLIVPPWRLLSRLIAAFFVSGGRFFRRISLRVDHLTLQPCHVTRDSHRSLSIRFRIASKSSRLMATSANWNVTYRERRTTFAPILIAFSRKVVSDQCFIFCGRARRGPRARPQLNTLCLY